ncbi:MAG TPA: MauE/DoxX family redox-associated membrane protein [Pyrinomonadaceae bacterium]|nr:MauE/DoxX family redox-associated membrane protein [Pyrinomonadaceae bacterium]
MNRWLNILVLISRFGLAAMWLFAAGAKLYTLEEFTFNLTNLVRESLASPLAISVIAAELLAAVLLCVPRTARLGAALTAAMLTGFALYGLYYVYVAQGEPLECGCFGGIIGSQLGVKTALRNLLLLVPAALVFFGTPRLRGASTDRPGASAV